MSLLYGNQFDDIMEKEIHCLDDNELSLRVFIVSNIEIKRTQLII